MVSTMRVSSIVTLGLLGLYYVLRGLATRCNGLQCEQYTAPSLVLPLLILVLVAVTGLLALSAARHERQEANNRAMERQTTVWLRVLGVCTLLGVFGPFAGAVVLRDHPDVFVGLATALILLVPLSTLMFSLFGER